eukprot:7578103-Alexandrium_andersonii.AAC.1
MQRAVLLLLREESGGRRTWTMSRRSFRTAGSPLPRCAVTLRVFAKHLSVAASVPDCQNGRQPPRGAPP